MDLALPSDVDHKVPDDPEHALYPTYKAWLKWNAQLKLFNFSYLSVLTVKHFYNLNSKSFLLEQRIFLNQYM